MSNDAPATPEQAQLDVEIQDVRAALAAAVPGAGTTPELHARLTALYQQRYREPGAPAPHSAEPVRESMPLAPPDLTPGPPPAGTKAEDMGLPALPEGHAWDTAQATAFYTAAESKAVPRHYVTEAYGTLAEAVRNTARGEQYTVAGLQKEMTARYGAARWDYMDVMAGEAFQHLPQPMRHDLRKSGLAYYPPFTEALVRIGERLRDGTTEHGLARLKELFADE